MLCDGEGLRQEASALACAPRGRVRLGSMPSVSETLLPELLARLRGRHPGIDVVVMEGHDDELVRWLLDGTVDVAVTADTSPRLESLPLGEDELLAVLPADHPLARRGGVPPRALAGERFILAAAGCERLILKGLRAAGVEPNVTYEVLGAGTILAMVAEGLGVSVMPALCTRAAGDRVALLPLRPTARRRIFLSVPADRDQPAAVRSLLDEARCDSNQTAAGERAPPPIEDQGAGSPIGRAPGPAIEAMSSTESIRWPTSHTSVA